MKYLMFFVVLVTVCSLGCRNRNEIITGLEGKPMPTFSLLLSDSLTHLKTSEIPKGKPVIFFAFGPNCPYSRAEMADIIKNMNTLKDIHFYIFTRAPYKQMMAFYNYYKLQNYPNMTIGVDTTNYFGSFYNTPGVPYLAVYDNQKRLTHALLGKLDAAKLKYMVQE